VVTSWLFWRARRSIVMPNEPVLAAAGAASGAETVAVGR